MKKSLVIVAVISTFDVVTSFSNTASASTSTNVSVTEGAQRWGNTPFGSFGGGSK